MTVIILGCDPPRATNNSSADTALIVTPAHVVLNQVIEDVLTNPELKDVRGVYAQRDCREIFLIQEPGTGVSWPASFTPSVPGYQFRSRSEKGRLKPGSEARLGIRLDKCFPNEVSEDPFEGNLKVTLMNVGGTDDGHDDMSGTGIDYSVKKTASGWEIHFLRFRAP
jgi:hypothetical protein